MATVMVSCGEASGDLYAGALAEALQARAPGTRVIGLGGQRLAASGAELAGDYRGIAVTGLTEVLRVLPRTYSMYRRLVNLARTARPDVFVAIDFPDFNFRLAGAVHARPAADPLTTEIDHLALPLAVAFRWRRRARANVARLGHRYSTAKM